MEDLNRIIDIGSKAIRALAASRRKSGGVGEARLVITKDGKIHVTPIVREKSEVA